MDQRVSLELKLLSLIQQSFHPAPRIQRQIEAGNITISISCLFLSLNSGGLDEMTAGLAIITLTLGRPFLLYERTHLSEHYANGKNLILPPFSSKLADLAEVVRLKWLEKVSVSLRNGLRKRQSVSVMGLRKRQSVSVMGLRKCQSVSVILTIIIELGLITETD